MSSTRIATVLVAAAGVGIAAVVGYLLHKEARRVYEAHAVVEIVGDATAQLKRGLKISSPDALEIIEGSLREVSTWSSNPEVADATEYYLIGARHILRRRADVDRLKQQAAASRAALSAHMMRAAQRDTPWIRTALQLKKQVERDHADLDVQFGALADLLRSFPDANKRLAPHVQASLLLEDTVRRSAHQAVLDEAQRARAELEKTRSWVR
jgi:hypothetical protein